MFGFTLLETLIALLIWATALLSLAELSLVALHNTNQTLQLARTNQQALNQRELHLICPPSSCHVR